jgi:CRISPR-associated endonuclease Cas1
MNGPSVIFESTPLTPDDVADTTVSLTATFSRDTSSAGICVVDGTGLRLSVDHGALVVEDGIGEHRRHRRFERATHGLRRLVVLGVSGNLSLDALHWCRRLGIGVVVLAPDGTAVLASTPRATDDARLRRAQALAPEQPIGLDLARWIMASKLSGQAKVLAQRFGADEGAATLLALADALSLAGTVDEVRQLEASAASLYFGTWTGRSECTPHFATRDLRRVPPHWSLYEGRRSVLASGNSNRKAERPTNAILNYVYALLEVEAVLACQVVGLDPGMGIVHSDTRGRSSLALDLIEPVRPAVDEFVLDLLERRTFRRVEFTETPDGHARLRAPLTHDLAETLPMWAKLIAPIAEKVAHDLGKAMAGKYQPATPLTRKHAHAAAAAVKVRKAAAKSAASSTTARQRPTGLAASSTWSCPGCGRPVANPRHVRCDVCIESDPGQTPEIRGRRGAAIASRKRALREWEEANPNADFDPELFRRDILPGLVGVKLAEIVEAIGCSKGYASTIRAGKQTPHVSTWKSLGALAGFDLSALSGEPGASLTPHDPSA